MKHELLTIAKITLVSLLFANCAATDHRQSPRLGTNEQVKVQDLTARLKTSSNKEEIHSIVIELESPRYQMSNEQLALGLKRLISRPNKADGLRDQESAIARRAYILAEIKDLEDLNNLSVAELTQKLSKASGSVEIHRLMRSLQNKQNKLSPADLTKIVNDELLKSAKRFEDLNQAKAERNKLNLEREKLMALTLELAYLQQPAKDDTQVPNVKVN